MKSTSTLEAKHATAGLDDAMGTLLRVSGELSKSYDALSARAKRVEQELERANAELGERVSELEAILEALPTGVLVRDGKGRIQRVNDSAASILGHGARDLLGSVLDTALDSTAIAEGEPGVLHRPDGARRRVDSRTSTIGGSHGGSVEILDDRTELCELNERLHRTDKMAALGNMASGIAHEIRNPMNAIGGFAALLLRNGDLEGKSAHWADCIVQGIGEVNGIVASMLDLARTEDLHLESIDVRPLIESAVAMTPAGADDFEGQLRIDVELPSFLGDRIKLRQALRNLVANALDVQGPGAQVEVSARLIDDEITFYVDDAGPGIAPESRDRLFDAFYTSRAEGTGLGLSLVHTLVALHGGRAEASPDPSPLGGARFAIRIPRRALRIGSETPAPTQQR